MLFEIPILGRDYIGVSGLPPATYLVYNLGMLKKLFIYLLRMGVGFYFAYPAIQLFMKGTPANLSKTIYQCVNTFYPQFSTANIWMIWTAFFVVLGLMIAFWKTPLSWIIFGIIILFFKLSTTTTWTLTMLIQVIPVLLVSIALAIYYAKNEFGHGR